MTNCRRRFAGWLAIAACATVLLPLPRAARGADGLLTKVFHWGESRAAARRRADQSLTQRLGRAGHPQRISPLAAPSIQPRKYSGFYTGGAGLLAGDGRDVRRDGTWGVDYRGWPIPKLVWLSWKHARHGPEAGAGYGSE